MKQTLSEKLRSKMTPKVSGLIALSVVMPIAGSIAIGCELSKRLEKEYGFVALPASTFIGGVVQYGLYNSLNKPIEMNYALGINPYIVELANHISKVF